MHMGGLKGRGDQREWDQIKTDLFRQVGFYLVETTELESVTPCV